MKKFLQAVVSLMILGLIVVGPFTLVYFASRVPTAFSQGKEEQNKVKDKEVEKPSEMVEKKEAESDLLLFVQKQHDWFLGENMDAGQWGRELGWGTGCYCLNSVKCINTEGKAVTHFHFLWYAWANSDGLIIVTLNMHLTEQHKESIAKIPAENRAWVVFEIPGAKHSYDTSIAKVKIETDNTWTEKFCALEGESWKCNERAALEAILKRLDELPFFDSLLSGIKMFAQKGE